MKSKVKYEVHGDILHLFNPEWESVAFATLRDDYAEEIQSVTWTKNGNYLYSSKLKCYLHIYIMKKWYGSELYEKMKQDGYIVDHMDNVGFNCCIDNLCFLTSDENIAKGHTIDKMGKDKTKIAISLYKDFETQYIQMTISFNYPAIARVSSITTPATIDVAYLLYNTDYEIAINDARAILYNYNRECVFQPEKLHHSDYHIEGSYGIPCSIENYIKNKKEYRFPAFYMTKLAAKKGWKVEEKRQFLYFRGEPQ